MSRNRRRIAVTVVLVSLGALLAASACSGSRPASTPLMDPPMATTPAGTYHLGDLAVTVDVVTAADAKAAIPRPLTGKPWPGGPPRSAPKRARPLMIKITFVNHGTLPIQLPGRLVPRPTKQGRVAAVWQPVLPTVRDSNGRQFASKGGEVSGRAFLSRGSTHDFLTYWVGPGPSRYYLTLGFGRNGTVVPAFNY